MRKGQQASLESRQKMSRSQTGKIMPLETKLKISKALKLRYMNPDNRQKLSEAKIGHFVSEETRKKIGAKLKGHRGANKGGRLSPEHIKKISASKMGHSVSEEARQNMSKAHKGIPLSTSHRENVIKAVIQRNGLFNENSKVNQGKPHKESTKEKISQKLKGRIFSHETREKMSFKRQFQVMPIKDTGIERILQFAITLYGIQFRKHEPLFGQPDIFIEPNICVFADGDFFHAKPDVHNDPEKYMHHGKTAGMIWARDKKVTQRLTDDGNIVIRFWGTEINDDANECALKIIEVIKEEANKEMVK